MATIGGAFSQIKHDAEDFLEEIAEECNPCNLIPKNPGSFKLSSLIHIPYLPAIHQPGWMMRYGLGPFDKEWTEMFIADCQAGLTVTMTLIPQGLSQATLANLPPIYGLYTALIPSATYAFFGSSMQLTVGPTALISLLTGSIITKYGIDFEDDLLLAVDTAAQAAFCCGFIIMVLGLLNLGNVINFMSHPVMSGFTTGAAMTIGLSQLKAAVGMSLSPPQVGRDVEYTYEVCHWWLQNWHGTNDQGYSLRNPYASKICFGLYIPLMFVTLIKWYWKPTSDVKKSWQFKMWTLFTTLLPLAAIIIGGHVAYTIKASDHFQDPDYEHEYYAKSLKIVGEIPAGVDILRIPHFRWPMGQFFLDVLPLTLIAFMESYSIARSIAASNNQLNMLNASQEMFANGVANLMGCLSSAYPVSGSFSRSALNAACGAKTPFSLSLTIVGVLICLTSLTKALRFIPQAALAAIIFCAIANLINLTDLWHSWKYSKKDFFTNLVTLVMVFCFDTSVGLAAGIACSVVVYCVFDIILAKSHAPRLFSTTRDEHDVDVVRIESDLNFLTSARVKDFITALALEIPVQPAVTNRSEYVRFQISSAFDYVLKPNLLVGVEKLPKAVVIDLCIVKTVDITGLEGLAGAIKEVRSKGVLVAIINANPDINNLLKRYGIRSDKSTDEINFEEYEQAYRLDLWSLGDKLARLESGKSLHHQGDIQEPSQSHFTEVELATVGGVSEHGYTGVPTSVEFKSMDVRLSTLADKSDRSL